MLDHARDCLAARNLSGLLSTAQNLPQIKILDLLESALRSKKEWAWPHLVDLIEPHYHTSVLCLASVHAHRQCFDAVFKHLNWKTVSAEIAHDLVTRCATHNDTHGFLKVAEFVPMQKCSNIALIAVHRNNPDILVHVLSTTVLTAVDQRQLIVAAVEMEHEKCLDILLPYITFPKFDEKDIRHMMHHVGAPADLFEKISDHFTQDNFNTILRFACVDGNEDVVDWAFRLANAGKVLKTLEGEAFDTLQDRMNQAQNDRLLRSLSSKPTKTFSRKM